MDHLTTTLYPCFSSNDYYNLCYLIMLGWSLLRWWRGWCLSLNLNHPYTSWSWTHPLSSVLLWSLSTSQPYFPSTVDSYSSLVLSFLSPYHGTLLHFQSEKKNYPELISLELMVYLIYHRKNVMRAELEIDSSLLFLV